MLCRWSSGHAACLVVTHGRAPESRRLQVYVIGRGLLGWISCVAKSGRKLVTMIGAPGSTIAANAQAEAQTMLPSGASFVPSKVIHFKS
eukprot:g18334.t1